MRPTEHEQRKAREYWLQWFEDEDNWPPEVKAEERAKEERARKWREEEAQAIAKYGATVGTAKNGPFPARFVRNHHDLIVRQWMGRPSRGGNQALSQVAAESRTRRASLQNEAL